jgi:ribosome-associated protein
MRSIVKEKKTIRQIETADMADKQRRFVPDPEHVLSVVQSSLEDDKAEDLVVIPLAEKSNIADYMVIASGRSQRQVSAMAGHLQEKLKAAGLKGVRVEGAERCDWVLLDAGDVIVHLFRPEVRAFYNLEKMWALELPDGGAMPQANGGTA